MGFPWLSFPWISFSGVFIFSGLLVFHYRYRILAYLPPRVQARFAQYAPVPDFEAAQLAGFESSEFSINNNLTQDDHRQLDIDEVRRIMLQKNCSFDEARLIRHKRHLKRNGIDPVTGLPTDKKAITSLA
ncbi:hypothetical protein PTTG_09242 [Puccinia triticina 1-1 BBBD Race 1]|uniref:Uncharacterized protein n=2 Tax=Puccinia triticina TaxID=208348 RepID=A0A0C4F7V8_PUCT1|nr:uncharacterized protein PtA15_14A335 [Puccinia triticina]OAV94257.1 hypothetical protein PTTG_09242 [Puccinia triticina 1-1 BBBD Race 1]WAQ91451.1 hypothetical protein PtA15_14A335 [Puccinia triticina]WAR62254.1 hypothetical protein PtB15_14B349 [Puccinia triticina]